MHQPEAAKRAWHLDVGENRLDVVARFQDANGDIGIGGVQHSIAGILQHLDGAHADDRFVLDNQYDGLFQRLVQYPSRQEFRLWARVVRHS